MYNNSPIVVCSEKNEINYLPVFLDYYRKLGVKEFAIIDNMSDDGVTIDYLKEQKDVKLFVANQSYTGKKKTGWNMRIAAFMGMNRWYLVVDSDELLTYPQMEEIPLTEYVARLNERKIEYVRGILLDMYPQYGFFNEENCGADWYNDYRFFDKYNDRYYNISENCRRIYGGMRYRYLGSNVEIDKCPLVFIRNKQFLINSHTLYTDNPEKNIFGCVLRHYKFLPNDINKYKAIVDNGGAGYSSLQIQKQYLEIKTKQEIVYGQYSTEYRSSKDILQFPFIRDLISE